MFTFPSRLVVVLATAGAIACGGPASPSEPFGFRYEVLLQPDPPVLSATTLNVTVSYGGCRGGHSFRLRTDKQAGSATVWLQKSTPDESCDMLITERREFTVPDQLQGETSVLLLAPDMTPYQLRP